LLAVFIRSHGDNQLAKWFAQQIARPAIPNPIPITPQPLATLLQGWDSQNDIEKPMISPALIALAAAKMAAKRMQKEPTMHADESTPLQEQNLQALSMLTGKFGAATSSAHLIFRTELLSRIVRVLQQLTHTSDQNNAYHFRIAYRNQQLMRAIRETKPMTYSLITAYGNQDKTGPIPGVDIDLTSQ